MPGSGLDLELGLLCLASLNVSVTPLPEKSDDGFIRSMPASTTKRLTHNHSTDAANLTNGHLAIVSSNSNPQPRQTFRYYTAALNTNMRTALL